MKSDEHEHIQRLLDYPNDAILIFDFHEGCVIELNQLAEDLLLTERSQLIGVHFTKLIHPTEIDDACEKWAMIREGYIGSHDRIMLQSNGASVVVRSRNQLLFDLDDQPAYVQTFLSRKDEVVTRKPQATWVSQTQSSEFQEKLHILHEITFEFYNCETVNELAYQVIKLGVERLGFERLGLLFFDNDYKYLLGVYGSDEAGNIQNEHGKAWKLHPNSREIQLVNTNARAKYWGDTILWGSGEPIGHGWDVLSILWDGKKGIGLLSTDNYHTGAAVKPYIVDLMALYGNLVGHLITKKRKEVEAQQYLEQLRLLQKIDRQIMSGKALSTIAKDVIHQLQETIGSDFTSIKQYNPETKDFILLADTSDHIEPSDEAFRLIEDDTPLKILKLGLDDDEDVMSERVNALLAENEGAANQETSRFIPIVDNQKFLGVLNIGLLKPKTFQPKQIELAFQVANQFLIGMIQANMAEQIKLYTTNLEDLVKARTAQLNSKAEELEAFTYSVSHDLRSPLRAIDGFSRTLVDSFGGDLPEKAQHYLNRVRHNAVRMGKMIDDLLELSRVGRKEIRFSQVDLNRLIQDILTELENNNQRGMAAIEVAKLPFCYGDKNLLRLAIFNLISNAIKYSRDQEKPKISFDFYLSKSNNPIYTIKDNGVGFDMKYVDKLFGVFQRLHTNREYEGNGIGLVTVHRIFEKHGGKVWAEAEINKGATFFFTFEK